MKTNEFDPEARTDQQALTQRVRAALDASVDELDGATLSRLNQARHHALENARRGWRQRVWLAFGAVALASLAIVVTLPLPPPDSTSTPDEATLKKAYQASADDLELVEDLDLVLALLENDDHAS